MKTIPVLFGALVASVVATGAQPALTVYNRNFAVVREHVSLDLKPGANAVAYAGVTTQLEPDSVVLRDPSGRVALKVLEQSYRADTVSQGLLLSLHEGRELDFLIRDQHAKEYVIRGKVVRSGYIPHLAAGGLGRMQAGHQPVGPGMGQPIIEVDGKLRFSLPGEPLFPALDDDAILKPTLTWQLAADRPARFDAELSYVTGGMSWEASYNLISPEKGDTLEIVGWVTIANHTGKQFDDATVKLMAGDVSKLQPPGIDQPGPYAAELAMRADAMAPVTEKAFDEFHLYSLPRRVTLRNRETKQVEFLRAGAVKARTLYIYNGAAIGRQFQGWNSEMIRNHRDYGTEMNKKVWVMKEFRNTEENGLGVPLPKGRTRFYRRDEADGRLEFTGENMIEHTARNEELRIYTGDAFDVVGERKRTDFVMSQRQDQMEEEFEIKLRNHKAEPVEVRVTERLYRWTNWQLIMKSHDFEKTDAQNIEFRVTVPADGEVVVRYRVRYDWR